MTELIDLWVSGRPRTKGSLKAVRRPDGGFRMVEEVRESKPWRLTIQNTIVERYYVKAASEQPADGLLGGDEARAFRRPEGWPWAGPVAVNLTFYFDRNTGDTSERPTGRGYGDIDKLTRNVLDALTTAGVYVDDSLVVFTMVSKYFVTPASTAGALIRVGTR